MNERTPGRARANYAALSIAAVIALVAAGCGGSDNSTTSATDTGAAAAGTTDAAGGSTAAAGAGKVGGTITGAGSSFAAPLYQQAGADFKSSDGVSVNYQPVGSGAGIAQFTANTVDYGATDAAMSDDEMAAAKAVGDPVHIPIAYGAITVAYNVKGVDAGLQIDGPTLGNIFLGKITKWNDPAIAALNSGVTLPDTAITIVHRSDGSGSTAQFTQYLTDSSPDWAAGPGQGKEVKWPVGTGGKGNDGVAAALKQTDGSIGYLELVYVLANKFTVAKVKNASGAFIEPTLESTSAASDGVEVPADLRFTAVNSPNATAYPIASATFALVYQDLCKAKKSVDQATTIKAWFTYLLGPAQETASKLSYAPLPADLQAKASAVVNGLLCNGAPIG